MDVFLEKDNMTIDINCDVDAAYSPNDAAQSISINLINKTTLEKISPSKYFNTFRYKLFCTALSCALALSIRRNSNVNLPLVMDDPFYGFDTQNGELMTNFIEQIMNIHTKFITEDKPLQVIIFTHDWHLFKLFEKKLSRQEVKFMVLENNKMVSEEELYNNNKTQSAVNSDIQNIKRHIIKNDIDPKHITS